MNIWEVLPRELHGEVAKFSTEKPFTPFPAAVKQGKISPGAKVEPLTLSPAFSLAMHQLPNHKDRGRIVLRGGIGAINFVTALVGNHEIYIPPSPKSAVDKDEGHINARGLAVLFMPENKARVVGAMYDRRKLTPWEAAKLGIQMPVKGSPEWEEMMSTGSGSLAMRLMWDLDANEVDLSGVDEETGEALLADHQPVYYFPDPITPTSKQ